MNFREIGRSKSLRFTVSQAMSSAATFATTLIFSRELPIRDYGSLAFALTFVYLVVSFQRATIGDPLLVYGETVRRLAKPATIWIAVYSCSTGLFVWTASLFFPLPLGSALPFIAGTLVFQDGMRYVTYSAGRLGSLFYSDLAWLTAACGFFAISVLVHAPMSVGVFVWMTGCAISVGFYYFRSAGTWRHKRMRSGFFASTHKVGKWSGLQFIIANGLGQASLSLMVAAVGVSDFAGYRAVQTVISPLVVGVLALSSPLVSRITALRVQNRWSNRRALKLALLLVSGLTPIALAIFVFREYLIRLLPGSQYESYSDLALPALIGLIFVAANLPISASMLAMMRGRTLFLASVAATVPTAAVIVVAAYIFGIEGAAWAMAFQYGLILLCGIIALLDLYPYRAAGARRAAPPMRHLRAEAE